MAKVKLVLGLVMLTPFFVLMALLEFIESCTQEVDRFERRRRNAKREAAYQERWHRG